MKKIITILAALTAAALSASAQDIQFHYDLGHNLYKGDEKNLESRMPITTTIEMFRPDKWGGSTYFFIDLDYGQTKSMGHDVDGGMLGAYWEISHKFKLGKAPISLQLEYDGGCSTSAGSYDDAWLIGPSYGWNSSDFSKIFTITPLFKYIPRNSSPANFQITGTWELWSKDKRFVFSGFIDFWREKRAWQGTDYILLTEPQFWYNLNTIKGLEDFNFSLGSETEISNNFVGKGFYAIPTLAAKWTF